MCYVISALQPEMPAFLRSLNKFDIARASTLSHFGFVVHHFPAIAMGATNCIYIYIYI